MPVWCFFSLTLLTVIFPQYNGINLRNATEQQARLVIGQQCDTITIMAQYNPHMYQLGNHSRSRYALHMDQESFHTPIFLFKFASFLFFINSSRLEPVSNRSTSQGSGTDTPDNHSAIDTLSEKDEGTLTPSSKQTTPTTSPHNFIRSVDWSHKANMIIHIIVRYYLRWAAQFRASCGRHSQKWNLHLEVIFRMSSSGCKKMPEPRVVCLRKTQGELGVQVCGGNLRGIFVEMLDEDSPTKGPDCLLPGDMILEVRSLYKL